MARYLIRKMNLPMPRHNVSGDYGVWDSKFGRWVLNAQFLNHTRARKLARLMNKEHV